CIPCVPFGIGETDQVRQAIIPEKGRYAGIAKSVGLMNDGAFRQGPVRPGFIDAVVNDGIAGSGPAKALLAKQHQCGLAQPAFRGPTTCWFGAKKALERASAFGQMPDGTLFPARI